MPHVIQFEHCHLTQRMDEGDVHGCCGCRNLARDRPEADVYIVDTRGRYWCMRCVTETLGEHTRRLENRPTAHYTWDFPDPRPRCEHCDRPLTSVGPVPHDLCDGQCKEPPEPDGEAFRGGEAAAFEREQMADIQRRLK